MKAEEERTEELDADGPDETDNATATSQAEVETVPDDIDDDDDDEDEDVCRVCRCPAEPDRPLFRPCKCSGSMGMTHQDCLTSWLEVTRGDGRCEICKTKFRFDPQYAPDTPDRLPAHEVLLGLSSRFVAKWLPLALRIFVAASLWLIVAPLLTNCLYHGWMIRPSSILTRWKYELILSDIVSGAVTASVIIVSFLSLLSFADFLRVHWQQPPGEGQVGDDRQQQRMPGLAADTGGNNENDKDDVDETAIDNDLSDYLDRYQAPEKGPEYEENEGEDVSNSIEHQGNVSGGGNTSNEILRSQAARLRDLALEREARQKGAAAEREWIPLNDYLPVAPTADGGGDVDDAELVARDLLINNMDDEDLEDDEEVERYDIDMDDDDDHDQLNWDDFDVQAQPRPAEAELDGAEAFDPMNAVLQDDQVDMEINVALDELLGLRGPLSTLVRNLLWLLAFNATYLGIFGFVPKGVGSVMYSTFFNTTVCEKVLKSIPYVHSEDENQTTVRSLLLSVEDESDAQKTTFKLSDIATVTLGYLSIAAMIVLSRNGLLILRKVTEYFGRNRARQWRVQETPSVPVVDDVGRDNDGHMEEVDNHNALNDAAGLGRSVGVALDAAVAVVKVAVLLFLKMFLLPLSLGLWLDVSTIEFFGHQLQYRVAFAGGDLFSFLLLHWVAGITFMLLVTVFLLQLREVTHPDILARVIRPQEPQPDLLGNLMHETVSTHMKRMLVSFAIYAPLLTLHVSVPVYLFVSSGVGEYFTFFHLNFYHLLMPQLEIPLELIIFHLCMLALLERYKNTIGGFQHRWLKFMCRKMGLTDYLLPRSIKSFELVGTKPILLPADGMSAPQVDPFFLELATKEKGIDEFISSNIDPAALPEHVTGETKDDGERVLSRKMNHISLTPKSAKERKLLPTKIGRFRLRLQHASILSPDTRMEFFREVQGDEIKRPPEGWDDLGAGGAFVQGRWAWTKEKKSVVEGGVAVRTSFRASPIGYRPLYLMLKVAALVVVSWIAIMFTTLVVLSLPLAVGRCFYYLLRIPGNYIHDPLAFCIGAGLFFPTVSVIWHISNEVQGSFLERLRRWISQLHVPPTRKLLVAAEAWLLWIVVAPVTLGLSYEVALVKSPRWFVRDEPFFDWKSFVISWMMGTVVLNTWAFLLYYNFFTRYFWAGIWNGILEPPPDDNGNGNQGRNNENPRRARIPDGAQPDQNADGIEGNQLLWQGQDGRVAKFFRIWRAVLVDWDWSKVDRTLLIEEFSRPVTKQLASALVGSSLSFQLAMYSLHGLFKVEVGGVALPFLGVVEAGIVRKAMFQLCMAFHVVIQLASGFRSSIDGWFEAAHEAARDDRYLIGELLMNYSPTSETTPP